MRQKWTSKNFTQLPICYMTWIFKTYQQEWEIWQPHISLFHLHLFSFYPLRHRIPSCLHTEASQGAENKDLTLFWTLHISNKWIMSGVSSLLWSLITVLQKDSLIYKLIHVLVNISFRITHLKTLFMSIIWKIPLQHQPFLLLSLKQDLYELKSGKEKQRSMETSIISAWVNHCSILS